MRQKPGLKVISRVPGQARPRQPPRGRSPFSDAFLLEPPIQLGMMGVSPLSTELISTRQPLLSGRHRCCNQRRQGSSDGSLKLDPRRWKRLSGHHKRGCWRRLQ